MSLSPELRQRVLSSVAEAPSPTRAQTVRARVWLFAAGIAGAIAIFFVKGGVRMTNRPPALVALTSLGTSLIAGFGMYFLFTKRGRHMLRRPWVWLLGAALVSAIGFLLWRYGFSAAYGLTERWPDRPGFRCLRLSVLTGALPLFAALVSWRRTDPITPAATGAAFGAGAGLGSAVLVDLWCPVSHVPHLLLGHVLPIVILAAVGALVGWRVLAIRRRG
jgi:hypothetical protein